MRTVPHHPEVPAPQMGCANLAARLAWFAAGPFALVLFALLIAKRGSLSWLDAAYWLTVGFILAMRWLDDTRFGGLNRDGAAATRRDWRRHAVLLALVAGAGWALAHAGQRWLAA